jgi:hypothetical protein
MDFHHLLCLTGAGRLVDGNTGHLFVSAVQSTGTGPKILQCRSVDWTDRHPRGAHPRGVTLPESGDAEMCKGEVQGLG